MARHRAVARSEGRWRGVSRLPAAQAAIESGSWDAVLEHDQVALVAHFGGSARASRSLEALLAALHDVGFGTAVISTSEVSEPLQFSGDVQPGLVVRRPAPTACVRSPHDLQHCGESSTPTVRRSIAAPGLTIAA